MLIQILLQVYLLPCVSVHPGILRLPQVYAQVGGVAAVVVLAVVVVLEYAVLDGCAQCYLPQLQRNVFAEAIPQLGALLDVKRARLRLVEIKSPMNTILI